MVGRAGLSPPGWSFFCFSHRHFHLSGKCASLAKLPTEISKSWLEI